MRGRGVDISRARPIQCDLTGESVQGSSTRGRLKLGERGSRGGGGGGGVRSGGGATVKWGCCGVVDG